MTIEKVLVIDDEPLVREFLKDALQRKKYDVLTAQNGKEAFGILKSQTFDVVITDMKMPDLTGLDILNFIKQQMPQTLVIVITAYGSIENAVEAMRMGAFHYLIKPFSLDILEAMLEKAEEQIKLVQQNIFFREQSGKSDSFQSKQMIATSSTMQKICADLDKIAQSQAYVFITGESGTGKEVIAHQIHQRSTRAAQPFIKVNCAAMPETLIESEFFGHEKGAFTGALNKKPGRFELANGGSLLLDEITEFPINLQAKLLRAIQEQEFERVGGTKPLKVDVRLISTSNRHIEEALSQQILRKDLYYRLNVIPIHLPPLRERKEDILPLAQYFLKLFCVENHTPLKELSLDAQDKLLNYSWPGNIRELANVIERAVVMTPGEKVEADFIYTHASTEPQMISTRHLQLPIGTSLEELEKQLITETLKAYDQNRTQAAKALGISTKTLRNKLTGYQK